MQNKNSPTDAAPHISDIIATNEEYINKLSTELQETLLIDRTTTDRKKKRFILWATNDYAHLGTGYAAGDEIRPHLITGKNAKIIRPRVLKALEKREGRTKDKAEVFTPSWVCNAQNNLVDDQWFGRENVFNFGSGTKWAATKEKIEFPESALKTCEKYVDAKRLEITCGEAPYLVSRYDTVSGTMIPIKERIGLLDRKLRVVNENTRTKEEWKKWSRRAVESIYGYEFQGDNLFLARENVFFTYIEYYRERFGEDPDAGNLNNIATVISWNLWQMDGFNYAIPYCEKNTDPMQQTIFEYYPSADIIDESDTFDYSSLMDPKGQALCKIHDWRGKETILYKDLVADSARDAGKSKAGGTKETGKMKN